MVGFRERLSTEWRELITVEAEDETGDVVTHSNVVKTVTHSVPVELGTIRLLGDELTDGTLEVGTRPHLLPVDAELARTGRRWDARHRLSALLHEPACHEVEDLLLLCLGEPVVLGHEWISRLGVVLC